MTAYRRQENMDQPITPIVSNNSNFVKGDADEVGLDLLGRRDDVVS